MFSRRVSHLPVQWLHRISSIRGLLSLLLLISAVGLASGFIGASAWRKSPTKKAERAQAEAFPSGVAATHRLSMRSQALVPVATVSAASFEGLAVAPDSIVASYGVQLATGTQTATDSDPSTPGIQLPTRLAGTTVEVNGVKAGIFFVSPGQVNFVIPTQTTSGEANVKITSGDGTASLGTVPITEVVPGVFTANANSIGVPAAATVRVKPDGSQTPPELVSKLNPAPDPDRSNIFIPKAIDLGPEGERVFLILYATGVRHRPSLDRVKILMGGLEVSPIYAGAQNDFVGLDQLNAEIPRSLIGVGKVTVSVTVEGYASSKLVDIEIGGTPGNTPPKVNGFGVQAALAGTPLDITGSGFANNPDDNLVRIAGHDSDVMDTYPGGTKLTVMVPFGVESGTVSVRTVNGEGISTTELPIRTSISGYVQNTSLQPLVGVKLRVQGPEITTQSSADGSFVLPDGPPGTQFIEVDGGSVNTNPPYPKLQLRITAKDRRDNQFPRVIALQQATGSGGTIGGSGSAPSSGEAQAASFSASE